MKQCLYCGAQLHEAASFCHACGRSQIEKRKAALPSPRKKRTALLLFILLLSAVSAFLWSNVQKKEPQSPPESQTIKEEPAPVEPNKEETLYYRTEDGEIYHLRLSFSDDGEAQARRKKSMAADQGKDGSFPSLLYISKESTGEFVTQDFLDQWVEYSFIESIPQNGTQALDLEEPYYDELEYPQAALKSDVQIGSYNAGDNIVRWTLAMKNGDVLTLEQTITIELMEVQKYSWTDISMNDMTELNALFERLDESTDDDQVVEIYLPPVTYEGGLELSGRSYRLYGTHNEQGEMTTFTEPSMIQTRGMGKMELHDICFRGEEGTGISCKETLFLDDCKFEGWDIAVHVQNNGWSQSDNCIYRQNGIGILFDCKEDGSFGPNYDENLFEDNDIGVQIKAVHNKRTLCFDNCVFRNNGADIDNQCGQTLDLSRTVFE